MKNERLRLSVILVLLGAGWGLTQPFGKIAVSDGYRHVGVIFWQFTIGVMLLGAISAIRGKALPMRGPDLRLYVIVAIIGTLIPNSATFEAARFLPSGWLSVVIAMAPLLAFPIALLLGSDRFQWSRLAGLLAGLAGVALLAFSGGGDSEGSLTSLALSWLPIAMIAPLFYAIEGNYVAKVGTGGLDATQVLLGSSLVGCVLSLPLAIATGAFIDPRGPWAGPDWAILMSSIIHALVYSGYVWMVGRAGAVFAAQVGYLVTGFGVLWAMLLLGERFGAGFWLALGLMCFGLILVRPRTQDGEEAALVKQNAV